MRKDLRVLSFGLSLLCLGVAETTEVALHDQVEASQVEDGGVEQDMSGKVADESPSLSNEDRATAPKNEDQDTAPKKEGLRLRQALDLALSNHPDFQVQRINPAIAKEALEEAKAYWDPTAYAGAYLDKQEASQTNRGTGAQYQVQEEGTEGKMGVRTQWNQTQVDLSATYARDTSNRTPEQQELRVGLSVEHDLLRGRRVSAPWLKIRRAHLDLEVSRHAQAHLAKFVLAQVEEAYWAVVREHRALEVLEASLRVARLTEKETVAKVEVGKLSPADGWAARSELANWEAMKIEQEATLATALLELQHLTGWTGDQLPDDLPQMPILPPQTPPDFSNRSDLAEAKALLEKGQLGVKATEDGLLPDLGLVFDLGKSGFGDKIGSLAGRLGDEDYDMRVGLEFSMPLGRQQDKARYRASQFEKEKAERAVEALERVALRDWRKARIQIESGIQRLPCLKEKTVWMAKSLEAEKARLEAGRSTALDVARLHREYVASLMDLEDLKVDLALFHLELFLSEGNLLERWGISLTD